MESLDGDLILNFRITFSFSFGILSLLDIEIY